MQTKCVRKTGAVFFGGREIIRGNLTRAKSARSIIKTRRLHLVLIMQRALHEHISTGEALSPVFFTD